MITSAFLLKVAIYGLITSLAIPVIDFLIFLFREGRKSNWTGNSRSTLDDWRPAGGSGRSMPRERTRAMAPTHALKEGVRIKAAQEIRTERISGRFVHENGTTSYLASNGVTITPVRTEPRPVHPHSDYWQYGSMAFYERG